MVVALSPAFNSPPSAVVVAFHAKQEAHKATNGPAPSRFVATVWSGDRLHCSLAYNFSRYPMIYVISRWKLLIQGSEFRFDKATISCQGTQRPWVMRQQARRR